jgi:hypothetical protein
MYSVADRERVAPGSVGQPLCGRLIICKYTINPLQHHAGFKIAAWCNPMRVLAHLESPADFARR